METTNEAPKSLEETLKDIQNGINQCRENIDSAKAHIKFLQDLEWYQDETLKANLSKVRSIYKNAIKNETYLMVNLYVQMQQVYKNAEPKAEPIQEPTLSVVK